MKPIRYYVFGGITAGLLTCMAVNANAQTAAVPRQMSYQGVLREGDKVVPDGKHALLFKLYTTESGGQPIWQETQLITMTGGLFNVTLGVFADLPAIIPKDAWIGISINNSAELIPRTKLMSAPYSFNAGTAQSLSPTATGAVLSLNGQQGAIELRATDGFEVRSDKGILTIGKSSQTKEDEVLNQGTEWVLAGNGNATINSWLGTSNNIPLIIRTNNAERMRILSSNGNVGIGETAPNSRLSVARTLHITNTGGTPELKLSAPSGANSTTFKTTGQSADITYTLPPTDGDANDVLMSNGTGVLTWIDNGWLRDGNSNITSNKFIGTTNNQPFIVKTNNIERYRVTGGGAIGINEDNPIQKLEVAGNILVKVDGSNTGELRFQEPPGFMGNNYVGLKAGSVVNNIVFTLPSSYPTQPGQVLSSSPSGVMTWITPDDGGGGSGLLYFEESRHTSSPNDGVPAHRFAAIGADNNIDVVLSPKGNGALMARLPDNTNAGGVKRGENAVDWQMNRDESWQVASGFSSVIAGGYTNEASGDFSVVGGGSGNMASGFSSVIAGGYANEASGDFSAVGGGLENRNDGAVSAIAGGDGNFIGFDVSGGFIGGGRSNRVGGDESGTESSSIVGGNFNEVYGNNSMIMGGAGLTLDGSGSFGFNANRFNQQIEDYDRNIVVNASNTGVLNNVNLWLANNDGTPRSLRFYESYNIAGDFPNGAHYAALRAATTMAANVTWTLPDADGTSGQVLSTNGSGVLSWATSGLQYFTEARNTTAPNDTRPVHQFAASGAGDDIDIALTPKGQGALTADLADATTTGGNKRGTYAVDWQMVRTNAVEVASGDISVIGGGAHNRAIGFASTISGGEQNTASSEYSTVAGGVLNAANADYSTIGGGLLHTASGPRSTIGGGQQNLASGQYSTVGGGLVNTASGSVSTVSGGQHNTASGEGAAIGGGQDNTASGGNSVISGGQQNTTAGGSSIIIGGYNNTASGDFSSIIGGNGLTLDENADRSFGFHANTVAGDRDMTISAANTAVFGNVDLWLASNDNTPRSLRFYEQYDAAGDFPNGSNYVGFRAPNSIAADVTWTLPAADGTSGQVLSTNGSGTLSWNTVALQYFTETRNTTAPNATRPVHQFAASGTGADIDIALTPKGAGALSAQIADGTATGGNKRGLGAVDWQMARLNATEVASTGYSTIGGGLNNTSSGSAATIAGGGSNTASGFMSFIGGGNVNTAAGILAIVTGGANNAATNAAHYSFIGGGNNNSTDGDMAIVIGGLENTASAAYSTILGGRGLSISGSNSIGFHANTVAGDRDMSISDANTAVLGNVDLWLASNDNAPRSLRFYEQYDAAGDFPNGSNYVGFRAPNSIAADVTWTLPDADGSSGQVLSTNGSGLLSWANAGGGLQYFTEARNTTAPNDVVPVHQFAATGTGTDIDIALTPKGTGALTAQIADETATGGNKRGLYAVDWQMQRSTQEQVASGDNSVIAGGNANDARGELSVVGGGNNNRNDGPTSVIAGGNGNFIGFDAENAGILGGNANRVGGDEAGSNNSTVVGGRENEVYGNNSTILGGRGLTLDGSGNVGFLGNNNTGTNDMVIMTTNTAAFANVDMWIVNNDNTAHELRIYEASGNGSNYTAFRAAAQATNVTYTLPPGDGDDGQTLTTNGAGQLSWRNAIPCGGIIMWTGDINAVPAGWALCDGTGGTPDLNDRFPRGTTNAANVGTQGGSDSHLHTVDDHNHTLSSVTASGTIDDGAVSGSIGTSSTGISASGIIDGGSDIESGTGFGSSVSVSVTDPGHDHSFTGSLNSTSVTVNLSGSTDTASGVGTSSSDNVPAYIYVGYIMKVCP